MVNMETPERSGAPGHLTAENNGGQKDRFLAAHFSIAGSVILFLISAVVGIAVDSITLILDASASLIILLSGVLMHFSARKIQRPPDELFHFGYHKYEPLTAVIQNALILSACLVTVKFAVQDIIHADDVLNYQIPAVATFFSGIIGASVMASLAAIARRTESQMIRSSMLHWLLDTFMSFGISAGFFAGLLLQNAGYTRITPYIDPGMSIILALFFIFTPLRAGTINILELLDAAPHRDIREKIKKALDLHMPREFAVDRVRVRKAGQKVFTDICFRVSDDLSIRQAEELAGKFEEGLKSLLPDCDTVFHYKAK